MNLITSMIPKILDSESPADTFVTTQAAFA
jgi:hypothetical protein